MAVLLSPYGGVGAQFLDNSGNVLTGGKIFTYAGGTTTPQVTYTSGNGSTPHSNPIILDASGRVPSGEIWLTDGLVYKFVLTTSTDVLIATYDGITGINSNFVSFVNQQEIQTATAGQTVFNLTTMTYQPGTNSLSVFVDGVNQYGPGSSYAYLETDSDTVTFVTGLHVGAEVKFTTSNLNSSASVNDAEQVSYIPPFTGSVATNVEAKLAQTVSVKDFGAVGDGVTDDTVAIQNALDSGVSIVNFPDGTYRTTDSLLINTVNQQIQLSPKCIINLNTTTNTLRVFDAQVDNVVIDGGQITTTYRDLDFLVKLDGDNCALKNSVLYFASKSNRPTVIYNQGGVELQGDGGEVFGCEIYNQEGQGVAIYGNNCSVLNNKIHDNITGVWGAFGTTGTVTTHCLISGNFIYDNNVNNDAGANGILINAYDGSCIVTNNTISSSGEHGTYIRAYSSVISNNIVYDNYGSGIKIRDQINSSVVNNICYNNSVGGLSNGEIYYQVSQLNGSNITIANNNVKATGANFSIRTAYTDANITLTNLTVNNNVCVGDMTIPANNNVVISNNIVTGDITSGSALPSAPAVQTNFRVAFNQCNNFRVGRCTDSIFENNYCKNMVFQQSNVLRNNTIIFNTVTNQTDQISRGQFTVFKDNIINCTNLTLPLLLQASTSAINSNKQIIGNRFIGLTVRIIDDTSSVVSGDKNIISNNLFDCSIVAFSFWGSGHSVMGNVNTNVAGFVAFVGCNNSWLIGNSPIATLRLGTTGNVVL